MHTSDYTTREVAELFDTRSIPDALALLHAARIPFERFCGAYVWRRDSVDALYAFCRAEGRRAEPGAPE